MQLEREIVYSSEELFAMSGEKALKAKVHYTTFIEFCEAAKKRIAGITEKTLALTLSKNDFGRMDAAAELRTNIVNLIRDHSFSFKNLFSHISMLLICSPSLLTDHSYDQLRSLVTEILQSLARGIQRFIFNDSSVTPLSLFLSTLFPKRKNSDSETPVKKDSENPTADISGNASSEHRQKKSESEKSPLRSNGKSKGSSTSKKVDSAIAKTSDESLSRASEDSFSKLSEDSAARSSESDLRRSPTLHQRHGSNPVQEAVLPIPSAQVSRGQENGCENSNITGSHRSSPATPVKERTSQTPSHAKEKDTISRNRDESAEVSTPIAREKKDNNGDDDELRECSATAAPRSSEIAFSSSSSAAYGNKSVLSHDSGSPLSLPKSYASNGLREASSSSSSSSASLSRLLQAGALSIQSPTLKHLISMSKANEYSDNREKYSVYLIRMTPLRLTALTRAFHPQSVVAIVRATRRAFSEPRESIKEYLFYSILFYFYFHINYLSLSRNKFVSYSMRKS